MRNRQSEPINGLLLRSARDKEPLINRRVNRGRRMVLAPGNVERGRVDAIGRVGDGGVGAV